MNNDQDCKNDDIEDLKLVLKKLKELSESKAVVYNPDLKRQIPDNIDLIDELKFNKKFKMDFNDEDFIKSLDI